MRLAWIALLVAVPALAARPPAGCHPRPAIETRALSGQSADRLRLAPGTTRLGRAGEFQLRDGRLLVQEQPGEAGSLYTAEQFKLRQKLTDEELRFRRATSGAPFHLLRSLIDDGDGFAARAHDLAAEARRRIGAEGEPASVDGVERLAARWREAGCREEPQLFRELTAWIGEWLAARAGPGARWATRPGDGGVVEPVIEVAVSGEVRRIAPWLWVSGLLDGSTPELARLADDALAPHAATIDRDPAREPTAPAPVHPVGAAHANTDERAPEKLKEVDPLDELADPGL